MADNRWQDDVIANVADYLFELRMIESRLESDVAGCLEHAAEGGNFRGRALSNTFECHRLTVKKLAERMEDDLDEMKGETK